MNRKTVELPVSGAKVVVRKLRLSDFVGCGIETIPDFVRIKTSDNEPLSPKEEEQRIKFAEIFQRAMVKCGLRLDHPDGRKERIVDKELADLKPGEIQLAELDERDLLALVNSFSEFNTEVSRTAKPFPEKESEPSNIAPISEGIRNDPKPDIEAVS